MLRAAFARIYRAGLTLGGNIPTFMPSAILVRASGTKSPNRRPRRLPQPQEPRFRRLSGRAQSRTATSASNTMNHNRVSRNDSHDCPEHGRRECRERELERVQAEDGRRAIAPNTLSSADSRRRRRAAAANAPKSTSTPAVSTTLASAVTRKRHLCEEIGRGLQRAREAGRRAPPASGRRRRGSVRPPCPAAR